MSFITLRFAGFVIIALILYYAVPARFRWWVLLAASYYFYLCTGIKRFLFILFTTLTTWGFSLLIKKKWTLEKSYLKENRESLSKEERKEYKAVMKSKRKRLLFLCLLLNFGILLFLKYANFFIAWFNLFRLTAFNNADFVPFLDVIMPLGISFYTFQSMGYLIDTYYGRVEAEEDPFRLALFISYFPQIIQGPISRFKDLKDELFRTVDFDANAIYSGFMRVLWGLFKKLVIADRVAGYVEASLAMRGTYQGPYLFLTVFLYSMQIYGDFSGGIDVALGVSEMFGIRLAENFERPFFSKNIAEYWRRWHITLGTWFKDYIFYPLTVSKGLLKLSKQVKTRLGEGIGKRIPLYIPLIAVWFLTGVWHGSEARYIVWGLLNCFFIILGTEFEPLALKIREGLKLSDDNFFLKLFRVIKTFLLMAFLRLFDISENVRAAFETMRDVFRPCSFDINVVFNELSLPKEEFICTALSLIFLLTISLIQRKGSIRKRLLSLSNGVRLAAAMALFTVVVVFGTYGMGYDAKEFIYLQF